MLPFGVAAPEYRPMIVLALVKRVPSLLKDLLLAPAFRNAALLILPYACLLVGMDIATRYGELTDALLPRPFLLSQDQSLGEYLEYSLMSAMAIMLLLMWLRERASIYLVNALLFIVLTFDNALEVHEKFGFWIAPVLPQDMPIAAHHLGEPVMFALIGIVWAAGLALSLRASRIDPVLNSLVLVGCIAATAFFGIFVDAVVSYGPHSDVMIETEAFIEDGGEFAMIILAFMLTVSMFDIARRGWNGTLREAPMGRVALA